MAGEQLPLWARKQIIAKKIRVFTLPGFQIAGKATDRADLQLRMNPPPNQGTPVSDRVAGLLRALAQLHDGEQTVGAVERAYRWLQGHRSWTVESVLDHLLELVSPLSGVEKSPETLRTDAALQRASTAYPKARILHLVRHPWSTVQSMLKAWSSLPYWNVDQETAPRYCLNVWLEQHRRIAKLGDSLGSDQFMRIRSEDIVDKSSEVLLQFCRSMAIDDSDESLRAMLHPERSPYACHGPMNARGGYDPLKTSSVPSTRLRILANAVSREVEVSSANGENPQSSVVPSDSTGIN